MKIGILLISTNAPYWQYIDAMIGSIRKHFLKNHSVDIFLWSDSPSVHDVKEKFYTEPVGMPWPTLMRYHLFLQKEEKLKDYDYIFYMDADMLFVDTVGDEVLSDGITAILHPGYAWNYGLESEKCYQRPFEPNPESSAYVFFPKYYFCGGFQGGKTDDFITAMKRCRQNINKDLDKDYIARWHDESHWNRYLVEFPPAKILDPSYCHPCDYPTPMQAPYLTGGLKNFYEKMWGRELKPKLLALTKGFAMTKTQGTEFEKIMSQMK